MIYAVDLYAGAGGASEGLLEAATARGERVNLTAVNHWPTAVATHTENHPTAQHYCMRIDALDPRVAVPGGKLDLLIAAPECTHHSTPRPRSVDEPIPTILAESGRQIGIAEPFIVPFYGEREGQEPRTHAIDEPVPTIPTDAKFGVVEPLVLPQGGGGIAREITQPIPTVHGDGIGLIESFIITPGGADLRNGRSVAHPLPTVTASDRFGVVEPFVVAMEHGGKVLDINQPVPTITTAKGGAFAIAEPFMTEYFGNGGARPITEPVPTLTTRDRLALVQPVVNGYVLDIRFRMLKPHELAAAMSFPKGYKFTGNKGEQVKQIGNAWDVSMGRALFGAILDGRKPKTQKSERVA